MMILITEDDSICQAILKRVLTSQKYEFEIANNGQEAVELSKNKKYDLILMDIFMPQKDGFAASTEIRSAINNINSKTPIIAVTSESYTENETKFKSSGINDFLPKPVRKEQLLKKISYWSKEANRNYTVS